MNGIWIWVIVGVMIPVVCSLQYNNHVNRAILATTFSEHGVDEARSIVVVPDGFFITGYSNQSIILMKLNRAGEILWLKKVDGGGFDCGYQLIERKDGNFFLAGHSNSFSNKTQIFVSLFNSSGEMIWFRTVQTYLSDSLEASPRGVETERGGIFLSCTSYTSGSEVRRDYNFIKFSRNGDLIYFKRIEGSLHGGGVYDVKKINGSNDSVIIVGSTYTFQTSGVTQNCLGFIIQFNTGLGSYDWFRSFGWSSWDSLYSCATTSDGNIIVSGSQDTTSGVFLLLLKLNSTGDVLWSKRYYGGVMVHQVYNLFSFVLETDDGGFIGGGRTQSWGSSPGEKSQYHLLVMRFTSSGSLSWMKWYGSVRDRYYDSPTQLVSLRDQGDGDEYAIIGTTSTSGAFLGEGNIFFYRFNVENWGCDWNDETNYVEQNYPGVAYRKYPTLYDVPAQTIAVFPITTDYHLTPEAECFDAQSCDPGYHLLMSEEGELCFPIVDCFGVLSNDSRSKCSGHGDCFQDSVCTCSKNYFARECSDFIYDLTYSDNSNMRMFSLSYYVITSQLKFRFPDYARNGGKFSCSMVVTNETEAQYFKFGNHSYCYFENVTIYGYDLVTRLFLVVYDSSIMSEAEKSYDETELLDLLVGNITIFIKTVSTESEIIPFSIFLPKRIPEDQKKSEKSNKSTPPNLTWLYVVVSILGLFFLVILICCLVVYYVACCVVCVLLPFFVFGGGASSMYALNERKKSKRFSQIDGLDMILKEQLLEKKSTNAKIRFKKELFEIRFEEVKVLEMIEKGGSDSVVFKAMWKGQLCAFKCFKTRKLCSHQESFLDFERELELMASLNHAHMVRFFGATLKPPRVGIVMEFCENGEILDFLQNFRESEGQGYPYSEKIRMLREVIGVMSFLHSRSIIHRDLKTQNVLVDGQERCKLADFGLSRIVEQNQKSFTRRVGTSYYIAPEVLIGKYNEKVDSFSFAILTFIVMSEKEDPYYSYSSSRKGEESMVIEFKVANDPNFRPDIEKLVREQPRLNWLKPVLEKCWSHDPEERKSFFLLSEIFKNNAQNINKTSDIIMSDSEKMNSIIVPFHEDEDDDVHAHKEEKEVLMKNRFGEMTTRKQRTGINEKKLVRGVDELVEQLVSGVERLGENIEGDGVSRLEILKIVLEKAMRKI